MILLNLIIFGSRLSYFTVSADVLVVLRQQISQILNVLVQMGKILLKLELFGVKIVNVELSKQLQVLLC